MAYLQIHGGARLEDPETIAQFVAAHGLRYESWDIDKLHTSPCLQDETEQARVLRVFDQEIEALKARDGYQSADVIALRPDTPGLEGLLGKFDKEHLHTEDEVRFVVDGRGIFTIHGEDGTVFDVEVYPGDLLVVPTHTWHWFTLFEDRQIKCIRIFESKEGWTPQYRNAQP